MNGFWDVQRVLVASHQAELRHEADATRIATDAMLAASAERTRHASTDDTVGHLMAAPRAIAGPAAKPAAQPGRSAVATPTRATCASDTTCVERTLAA
jgi:hypothetical protein